MSRWPGASISMFCCELMERDGVEVGTLKTPCSAEDVNNPNAVKVVTRSDGRALYFSRATIPFDRDGSGQVRYYKHLGFYAYRKAALDAFCAWPESATGAQRTSGAATVSRPRHRDPRCRNAVRHGGRGHGRGLAAGGSDSARNGLGERLSFRSAGVCSPKPPPQRSACQSTDANGKATRRTSTARARPGSGRPASAWS